MALTTGARIGPYDVLSPLGSGGMGEVYLAHDRRLGRDVAIKALRDEPASGDITSQLLREARAAAALVDRHIAAIHDVIEHDGRPMIVMEYVPGRSLDHVLRHERPTLDQALDWAQQVATALVAAHARDIIHCDIKPANLRLTPDGVIKVLDFGVARVRSLTTTAIVGAQPAVGSMTATISESAAGTLPYMAPEQLQLQPVDQRTDVYALGVVLYELLTGRRPFDGADKLAIAEQILSGSAAPVAAVNPAIPRSISEIVAKAMSRRASDRYTSAASLAESLRLAREPTASAPADVIGRLPGRRRWWRAAVALALTALAAVAIASWLSRGWLSSAPPVAPSSDPIVAVLPLRNLTGEAQNDYLSAGIVDVVTTKLALLPGTRVLSTSATSSYREGDDRVDRAARSLGATLVVDGSLQRAGDRLRVAATLVDARTRNIVWSGAFDAGVQDVFSLQRQLTDGLIGGLQASGATAAGLTPGDRQRLIDAPTSNTEAFANFAQGRSFLERPDVAGNLDRAATLLESAVALDPTFALAHAALGETYWAQYARTRDQSWIDKARIETLEALRLEPNQAGVRYSLAVIYNGTGRTTEAVEELRRAIALQPLGDDAHRLLGEILARGGDVDAGAIELQRAIELRPSYWGNHWSLGVTFLSAGRYEAAIPSLRRVTELQPDNARGFQALGTAYHQTADFPNAIVNCEQSIKLTPTMGALSNLATIHFTRGQFARAAAAYEQAAALGPNSAIVRRNLADAYEAMGDRAKARAEYGKAAELSAAAFKVNPQSGQALALLAYCRAKLGDHAAAQRDVERAVALAPTDKEVLYKRAVVRQLAGNSPGALEALAEAIKNGYSTSLVETDRDFANLRSHPEYARLIGQTR